jgi:hypothetical protein
MSIMFIIRLDKTRSVQRKDGKYPIGIEKLEVNA